MERFSQELLLAILRGQPPLAIRNFVVTCPSFSSLRDHKVLIPLVSTFIPHRNTAGYTLHQVVRLCANHPPNRAALLSRYNGEATLFLKEGKVYIDPVLWFGSLSSTSEDDDILQNPIVELDLINAVDVYSSGSSFTVAGAGYCARVYKKQTTIHTEIMLHPGLVPVQVVSRSRGTTTIYVIVNNDGRLFTGVKQGGMLFSDVKLVEVDNIPRISHIEVIKGKSQVVDVDGRSWTITDEGTIISDSRKLLPKRRDVLRKWLAARPESKLQEVEDIYGLIEGEAPYMCEGDGTLLLIKDNGSVEMVRVTGIEGGEYYYRQDEYNYFSF